MNKRTDYWRLKKREQRSGGKETVTVAPVPLAPAMEVTADYDPDKYPDREAFEIALERVARAQRYAAMFPHMIRSQDAKYQDLAWQYEHEGLKAAK